jgi:hypothetical protein
LARRRNVAHRGRVVTLGSDDELDYFDK